MHRISRTLGSKITIISIIVKNRAVNPTKNVSFFLDLMFNSRENDLSFIVNKFLIIFFSQGKSFYSYRI